MISSEGGLHVKSTVPLLKAGTASLLGQVTVSTKAWGGGRATLGFVGFGLEPSGARRGGLRLLDATSGHSSSLSLDLRV